MNEKELSKVIVETLGDKKAYNVVEIYVGELTTMTDYFIICTGTSQRHMRTLAESVEEKLNEYDITPMHREGKSNSQWILVDYGDVVVNIFNKESREVYNLERLWADGDIKRIEELLPEREK